MLLVSMDEVTLLAPIVGKFFQDAPHYQNLMDDISREIFYPEDTLFEFFSFIEIAPLEDIERMFALFFEIPYEQMFRYAIPVPIDTLQRAKSLCPPLNEGPYPWQTILAQWRLTVLKY